MNKDFWKPLAFKWHRRYKLAVAGRKRWRKTAKVYISAFRDEKEFFDIAVKRYYETLRELNYWDYLSRSLQKKLDHAFWVRMYWTFLFSILSFEFYVFYVGVSF